MKMNNFKGLLFAIGILLLLPSGGHCQRDGDALIPNPLQNKVLTSGFGFTGSSVNTSLGKGNLYQDTQGNQVILIQDGLGGAIIKGDINNPNVNAITNYIEVSLSGLSDLSAKLYFGWQLENTDQNITGVDITNQRADVKPGIYEEGLEYGAHIKGKSTVLGFTSAPNGFLTSGDNGFVLAPVAAQATIFYNAVSDVAGTRNNGVDPVKIFAGLSVAPGFIGKSGSVLRGIIDSPESIDIQQLALLSTFYIKNVANVVGAQTGDVVFDMSAQTFDRGVVIGFYQLFNKPTIKGKLSIDSQTSFNLDAYSNGTIQNKTLGKSFKSGANAPGNYNGSDLAALIFDEVTFDFYGSTVRFNNVDDNEVRVDGVSMSKISAAIGLEKFRKEAGDLYKDFADIKTNTYETTVDDITRNVATGAQIPSNISSSNNASIKFAPLASSFTNATNFEIDPNFSFPNSFNSLNTSTAGRTFDFNPALLTLDPYVSFTFTSSTITFKPDLVQGKNGFELVRVPELSFAPNDIASFDFWKSYNGEYPYSNDATEVFREVFHSKTDTLQLSDVPMSISQNSYMEISYNAATTAKRLIEDLIRSRNPFEALGNKWLSLLQEKNPELYDRLIESTTKGTLNKDFDPDKIAIVPKLDFTLEITPRLKVRDNKDGQGQQFLRMEYDITTILKEAVLQLAYGDTCEMVPLKGLAMDQTELSYLQEAWGADTDGDGIIDSGYLPWLQKIMKNAAYETEIAMELGLDNSFKQLNLALLPASLAQQLKKDIDKGETALQPKSDWLTHTKTVVKSETLRDDHLDSSKESNTALGKNVYNEMVFNNLNLEVSFLPSVIEGNLIYSQQEKVERESEKTGKINAGQVATSIVFEGVNYFNKPNYMLAAQEHSGIFTIKNTSNATLTNQRVIVTVKAPNDVGFFNVASEVISSLGKNKSVGLVFEYTPTSLGTHEFRLHSYDDFGQVLGRKSITVTDKPDKAFDLGPYCDLSVNSYESITANDGLLKLGNTVRVANLIENRGSLTLKATKLIEWAPGFEAKAGATVSATIVSCNGIKTAVQNTFD